MKNSLKLFFGIILGLVLSGVVYYCIDLKNQYNEWEVRQKFSEEISSRTNEVWNTLGEVGDKRPDSTVWENI
jgi:hypothetical protein